MLIKAAFTYTSQKIFFIFSIKINRNFLKINLHAINYLKEFFVIFDGVILFWTRH